MIYTKLTKLAMEIAEKAHRGQKDKSGFPYLHHPMHLAESMTDQYTCALALLHDVVEDTEYTFKDLRKAGIPENVLSSLRLLTHEKGVPYMDYVRLVGEDAMARKVKLADLAHNLDSSRLLGKGDPKKKDTYLEARAYLLSLEVPYSEFVLASSNPGKVKEYQSLLAPLSPRILLLEDIGFYQEIDENGKTYGENAVIKAEAVSKFTSLPVIADDSGIEIEGLGGKPGIYTARYAKEQGGFPAVWYRVIEQLKDKPKGARFVCNICLKEKGKEPIVFEGICPGHILDKPHGENGFGYDPIFHSVEGNVDFGVATEGEKDRYSHRGKASAKLLEYLLEKRKNAAKPQ